MIPRPLPVKILEQKNQIHLEIPIEIFRKYFDKDLDNCFVFDIIDVYDDEVESDCRGIAFWPQKNQSVKYG